MIFHLLRIVTTSKRGGVKVGGIQIGGPPPELAVICETPENAAVQIWNQNRKKDKEDTITGELYEINLETSMIYRKEIPKVHFMTGEGVT